jgi:condensin-2 complex subunit G2
MVRDMHMFFIVLLTYLTLYYCTVILTDHASDKASAAVRVGAVHAMTALLDTPESHAVLRGLLPQIGNLIHDQAESVRLATVQLLLRVKMIQGIKYFHVVPVDHLLARLAIDGGRNIKSNLCSSLTLLMLNSYVPQGPNVSSGMQIQRTITFIEKDPDAAIVFYSNLSSHLPFDAVVKLTIQLMTCFRTAVESYDIIFNDESDGHRKRGRKSRSSNATQSSENESSSLSPKDVVLLANLAEAVCVLWRSIDTEKQNPLNEDVNQSLLKSLDDMPFTKVLSLFESGMLKADTTESEMTMEQGHCWRGLKALLDLASLLPLEPIKDAEKHVSLSLASFQQSVGGVAVSHLVSAYLSLLCSWGKANDVAHIIVQSINLHVEEEHDLTFGSPESSLSRKRRCRQSKRLSKDQVAGTLSAEDALQSLSIIVAGYDPSSIRTRRLMLDDDEIYNTIVKCLARGMKYVERLLFSNLVSNGCHTTIIIINVPCAHAYV